MMQTKRARNREKLVMPWFSACLLLLFISGKFSLSNAAGDTLSRGQSVSGTQTIISQNGIFELGFFSTGKFNKIYLGISYKNFAERTTVWVANRETPLFGSRSNAKLEISQDGNLLLLNESGIVWSTNMKSSLPSSVEAVLLDKGNFVLRDSSKSSYVFWQSFDHPTDTWLPGAKLGFNWRTLEVQRLVSWKSSEDPSPGMFSLVIDKDISGGELCLEWNNSVRYWKSGGWTGEIFSLATEMSHIAQFKVFATANETYYTYELFNPSFLFRIVMKESGELMQCTDIQGRQEWFEFFPQPRKQSDVYAFCGAFGVFTEHGPPPCACLQGFVSSLTINGGLDGCERKTTLQCENSTSVKGKKDGFLKITNLKLPANSELHPVQNAKGCKLACLEKCSCTAYAFNGSECLIWIGALWNLKQLSDGHNNKQELYLKVADSELPDDSGHRKKLIVTVAVVVSMAIPVLGGFVCFGTRKIKRRGNKDSSEDLLSFDFSSSSNTKDDGTKNPNNQRKGSKKDFDLPLFSYASVSAATKNFSIDNKLGEGGFGPVYKGKALRGQEIAVKRLSKRSGQGVEEFRNEILLIAKLQHRNLVRLLGCCIDQDENILIYEYLPNKSLDFYLFDPNKPVKLEWRTRVQIIEGIAQGLLYLHKFSRLRIIHRDLKASNILLDGEMNPKISDFGMARIFGGNDSEANTKRIVGTYGYMAPEYALEGLFSIKSDVFSFGVLVLEIVSGKRNTGFYHSDSLNLIGHAWELWIANRATELMDQEISCPPAPALLRYINLGLLCVQENPNDRPTMSNIISMLGNELAPLPSPKQPAFVTRRNVVEAPSTSTSGKRFSVNGLTISIIEPR